MAGSPSTTLVTISIGSTSQDSKFEPWSSRELRLVSFVDYRSSISSASSIGFRNPVSSVSFRFVNYRKPVSSVSFSQFRFVSSASFRRLQKADAC